jgi:tRNA threonylcarbamoyladenosine biosynthesis protein TsaE
MNDATLQIEAPDEDAQVALGRRIAEACGADAVLYLRGELGAGKTTLTRGLMRGFGYDGPVKSPTYTLIEPYELDGRRVSHLDLYRVGDPAELEYLGLRELTAQPGVILVEWPERGEGWLPDADLDIRIDYRGAGRSVSISAASPRGQAILDALGGNLQ